MMTEIGREEQFLQSEELRLADRPPERIAKLREAHKEWIVWRVRKELEKVRLWREAERAWTEAEAEREREERETARLAEEERKRSAEKDRERREQTLKEERERAAREKGRGPYAWQQYEKTQSRKGSGYQTDPGRVPPKADPKTAPREWDREARIAREGWESYTSRWASLAASASSTSARPLRFGDIPWPIFSTGPFIPADITAKRVGSFLLSRFHSTDKTTKERLRAALIQWHPDKFEAKWLRLVDANERTMVTEGVGAVARAINDLLAATR